MLSGSLTTAAGLTLVIGGTLLFMVLFGPATAGMMKIMRNFRRKTNLLVHDFMKTFRAEFGHSLIFGFWIVCWRAAWQLRSMSIQNWQNRPEARFIM